VNLRKFFAELKWRNVYRVATALRNRRMAADADSDAGFPIALTIAWAFERMKYWPILQRSRI
jgi:hypothetical protein